MVLLKRLTLLLLFNLYLFSLSAQKQNPLKLTIETGALWDFLENRIFLSGPFINVEPKLKASKNTVIGLRIGAALSTQEILTTDEFKFYIDNSIGAVGIFSFTPTLDYYPNSKKLKNPYVGFGIGHYILTTNKKGFRVPNIFDANDLNIENQFGILFRGGVDCRSIILGFEGNYIPKANVETPNGQKMGIVHTSYLALSIGRTIGGNKRRE